MPTSLFVLRELRVIERVIEATLFDKLRVISLFNNRAVLYHENGICVLDSRKTVRNDEAGLVFHQLGHCVLYLYFGMRVDV